MATEVSAVETNKVERKRRIYVQYKDTRGDWQYLDEVPFATTHAEAMASAKREREYTAAPLRVAFEETVVTTHYTEVSDG